jgi:phosphohistidine phosphatase
MRLYVIRHADAVPLGPGGPERDEDRPLTPAGHEQSRKLGAALRRNGVLLERLLSSPLPRARETAAGIVAGWGEGAPAVEECEHLAPGSRKKKLVRELLALGGEGVGVVGHNPDVSELVGWFIGNKGVNIVLAKAATACVEFDGSPAKEAGALLWLVTPEWWA